jgi:NAD(P)-dependent dehydrogenase (short-subunit alcohol dehydrogenase family)
LGARRNTGNIGDAVATALEKHGWSVFSSDCEIAPGEFEVPDSGPILASADALVITLGRTAMEPFDRIEDREVVDVIEACLTLPLLAARRYVRSREEKGGTIVFTGSHAHRHPFSTGTSYCSAKAGINMAAQCLGWELTDKGFYTHVVHPYHVPYTAMWEQVQEGVINNKGMSREEADAYSLKDAKLPLMKPSQVADVVRLLLEYPLAKYLSGTNVELYGGTR